MNGGGYSSQTAGRPFVYIAALIRSGSTLLSELLTQLPYSYVFHEPHLGRNLLTWDAVDLARWREKGVNLDRRQGPIKLAALLYRALKVRPDFVLQTVRRGAFREAARHAIQLGVKETRNDGWRQYLRHFPNLKVLLTGRDPRDVYLSLHERKFQNPQIVGMLKPENLAADLMREFRFQMEMRGAVDCLAVRYEDLCTDPGLLLSVKNFIGSPIPDSGPVGAFMQLKAEKRREYDLHGGRVSARQVDRWRREKDPQALAGAWELHKRMQPYVDFWGYGAP
jgi:hypothetical protein